MSTRAMLGDLCLHTKSKLTNRSCELSSEAIQAAKALARLPFKDFVERLQTEEPELSGSPLELMKRQVDCFTCAMKQDGWSKLRLSKESKVSRRIVNRLFDSPPLGTRMKTLAAVAVTLEAPLFELPAAAPQPVPLSAERSERAEALVSSPPDDVSAVDEPEIVDAGEVDDEEFEDEFARADAEYLDEHEQQGDNEPVEVSVDGRDAAEELRVEDELIATESEEREDSENFDGHDDDRDEVEHDRHDASDSAKNDDEVHGEDEFYADASDVDDNESAETSDERDEYEEVEDDGDDTEYAAADETAWDDEPESNATGSRVDAEDEGSAHQEQHEREEPRFVWEPEVIEPEILNPPPVNAVRHPPRQHLDAFSLVRKNNSLQATNAKLEATLEQTRQQLAVVTDERWRLEVGAVAGTVTGAGLGFASLELGDYRPRAVIGNVLAGFVLYGGGKLLEESEPVVASFARSAGASTVTTTVVLTIKRKLGSVWQRWTSPTTQAEAPSGEGANATSNSSVQQQPNPPATVIAEPAPVAPPPNRPVVDDPAQHAPPPASVQPDRSSSAASATNPTTSDSPVEFIYQPAPTTTPAVSVLLFQPAPSTTPAANVTKSDPLVELLFQPAPSNAPAMNVTKSDPLIELLLQPAPSNSHPSVTDHRTAQERAVDQRLWDMLNDRSHSQPCASQPGVTRPPAESKAAAVDDLNRMFFSTGSDPAAQPEPPRQEVRSPGSDAVKWLNDILSSPSEEPVPARIIQLDSPPRAAAPAKDWLAELLSGS